MVSKHILTIAAAPLFLAAVSVLAAESQPVAAAPAPAAGDPWTFNAAAGASQMFDTDIKEDSGTFSRTRAGLALGLDYRYSELVTTRNTLNYTYDKYNFSDTFLDIDPWDNVHTLTYNIGFDYKVDDAWTVFGGPMVGAAAEDGADWGDAVIWGVAAGARYRFSPDLMIGLGIADVQPIEDNFAVLPIILFNWKITDQFALRSSSPIPGVTMGFVGVEGVWMFADQWELAVGAQAERSRFRLSDNHPIAPNGVGQVSGVPVYARLNWKANEQTTVSGICGMIFGGNLEIDNENGDKLGDDVDYDPAICRRHRILQAIGGISCPTGPIFC